MDAIESSNSMSIDARATFGNLLERHRGIVFKVVNTYAYDPEDRADLAQEIAMQGWRAYPCFDPQRKFSTWLYRIALNVAISHVRRTVRHRKHATVVDDGDSVPGINATEAQPPELAVDGLDFETEQRIRILQRFIRQLEPLDRALLLLYMEENSYREIAEILGITETNVATKLSRLKQRVRDEI